MSRRARYRAAREALRLRDDAANAQFDHIDWRYFGDFQPKTDEHGLTSEMREHLANRDQRG